MENCEYGEPQTKTKQRQNYETKQLKGMRKRKREREKKDESIATYLLRSLTSNAQSCWKIFLWQIIVVILIAIHMAPMWTSSFVRGRSLLVRLHEGSDLAKIRQ